MSSIGAGKVTKRLNNDYINKNEEAQKMMQPAHDYFKNLASECNENRICVDLYIGVHQSNTSIDLTTIAPIAGMTGGNIYFYQNFDVMRHGEKIYYELFRSLTRPTVSEVEYKARCS